MDMDWEPFEELVESKGLINSTYYGDWGCTMFKTEMPVGKLEEDSEVLGKFCADGGMVCVLEMKDAVEIRPDIERWIRDHDWCATIIRGFSGRVRLMTFRHKRWLKIDGKRQVYDDIELRVRGDGEKDGEPFSFESVQTSL